MPATMRTITMKNTASQPDPGRPGEWPLLAAVQAPASLFFNTQPPVKRTARHPGGAGAICPEPDPVGPCRRGDSQPRLTALRKSLLLVRPCKPKPACR